MSETTWTLGILGIPGLLGWTAATAPDGLGLLVEFPGLPMALEVDDEVLAIPDLGRKMAETGPTRKRGVVVI